PAGPAPAEGAPGPVAPGAGDMGATPSIVLLMGRACAACAGLDGAPVAPATGPEAVAGAAPAPSAPTVGMPSMVLFKPPAAGCCGAGGGAGAALGRSLLAGLGVEACSFCLESGRVPASGAGAALFG